MRVHAGVRLRSIVFGLGLGVAGAAAGCGGTAGAPAVKPAPPATESGAATAAAAPAAPAPAPALTALQRAALKRDGMAAYDRKEWATCARMLEQADDAYDAACCYAQAGDRDNAFRLLERAIRVEGFSNGAHLAKDPDLAPLHGDPRWEQAGKTLAAAAAERKARLNAEMLQLYEDDQGDRSKPYTEIDWKVVGPRDEARRKRVDEIVKAGGAKVADDYYHGAMVYQHGETPEDIQRARDLALKAVELDPNHKSARWLAAAAEDRKLMYEKKPQKWGTQYQGHDGKWELYEIDPSITDEQRAEWNVPSLAEARARADEMTASNPPPKHPPPAKTPPPPKTPAPPKPPAK
jgi:tetratricopeptide (TPR) repeat protein